MKILQLKNYDLLSAKAAEMVQIEIAKKPNLILGLPTGSTPLGMYAKLVELSAAKEVDFSEVRTYNLDEYYPIKRSHPQSYHTFMFENFFTKVNINPYNIHILNGEAPDSITECKNYEAGLLKTGYADLMVLGVGANGHIGFNEPGDFSTSTHVAELSLDTRSKNARFFDSITEVPLTALTMGLGSILKSKMILVLISGEVKEPVLKALLSGKLNPKIPATYLLLHRDVVVLTDIKIGK